MKARAGWAIAAGLVVALMLAGCSGGTTPAETPPAQPAADAGAATQEQQPAEQTDAGAASAATTPMGTMAKSGTWEITVKESERDDSAGGAKASGDNELLVIAFDLKNAGTADEGVGPTSFKLVQEGDGTEFQATPTNDPKFIFNTEQPIKAGETREIRIAYEVPKGAGPFTWTYAPFSATGDAVPAVLAVK